MGQKSPFTPQNTSLLFSAWTNTNILTNIGTVKTLLYETLELLYKLGLNIIDKYLQSYDGCDCVLITNTLPHNPLPSAGDK